MNAKTSTLSSDSEKLATSPPSDALNTALAEAEGQVEAMTGNWLTPARFRLLDQRHGVPPEKRRAAIQLFGSLDDNAFCNELWRLNSDGYDVYIVAQSVRLNLPSAAAVNQDDIEEARVLFADADDHDPIAKFHIAPTFRLRRENSPRHFWLGWRIEDMQVNKIREAQQRIAQRYGTDKTVCDPARIIRLAGFTSHKREQKTRYIFERMPGKPAQYSDHAKALPKFERAQIAKGDGGEDYISEKRLRFALTSINPECGKPGEACRNKWIATLGPIMDAKIGRDDKTYMEDFDKIELADKWSSGALGNFDEPANYKGFDDVALTMENLSRAGDRSRAGIGSIIMAAKVAGMDAGKHEQLRKAEPFTQPSLAAKLHLATKDGKPTAAPVKPEGLYDGPDYAKRPEAQWLIRGVLQETSYSIASGRSQAGKSFCELALALSIASGEPWLGLKIETKGPVLYVAAEGQGRIWQDVRAWCARFGIDPESLRGKFFIFDRSARLNTDEGKKALDEICAWIRHVADKLPIYAVFDTLRRNMRGGVSQEEPTSDVLHKVNELQTLGIAVTLVAHHGRSHDETKGLTEWEDDADGVRHYGGTVRDSSTKIEFTKIKSGEDGWSIAVEYTTHQLPDGASTLVAATGKREGRSATKGVDKAEAHHRSKFNPRPSPDLMEILDKAVVAELSDTPGKWWTTRALAEAVAMRDEIGTKSSTLEHHALKNLRESKSTTVNRSGLYDNKRRVWIWRK